MAIDLAGLFKTVAPWIGTALGGPLGGMAVEAAASALGISDKTADAVKNALSGATPEQVLALKQADQQFAIQMQQMGFKQVADLEALTVDDRKSARVMQQTAPSFIPAVLSCGITGGYFIILVGMMTKQFVVADSQVLLIMLGALSTAWGQVLSFWFGSTRQGENKTALLAQAEPIKK